MSYTSKYLEELKKIRGVTDDAQAGDDYTREYLKVLNELSPVSVQQEPVQTVTPKQSKKKKEEEKLDFFKKGGLFEDGWDFGDGWRTMGLTIADASLSILEGLGGMAEGVLDLGGHLVAGGADLLGADDFADDVRKIANHNTVSKAAEWIRDVGGKGGIGEGSVLGRTTKIAGQGLGQIGGIVLTGGLGSAAGLSGAAVSALTSGTMFASSTGAGIGEAYNDGASDAEAWAYGTIKGGIDAASELIFGGLGKGVKALGVSHGLSSADDILAKKLSSKISSKVAKTFVQAGVKAGGEGLEEVLAGLGTAAAKLIYKDGVSYQELLEDENLLEQFVVGAMSSGLAQSGGVVNSVKTGRDFISGMTANEETVVNKEVEKRIVQEEENGNKLSNKEKNAIYDAVVNDMDKGRISADTIEEALGGDTFKAYQDALKSETAAKEEYEKLANTPKGELTHIQEKRLAELEAQIEAEPKSKALKQQLQDATFNLAKDSRLAETYNEQGRRKQAFQADLTKYDAKQAEVVKKAVESGILNNTNRTHEFVDLVAKISADKGVSFDFANNAKIKESGFAVDGATVNGFVTDSGITVNIQSAKALNTVVGHEITHILEGTELYDGLQKAVVEYAKTKGEYDSRLAAITKLYEGKNADVNKELVADLVGDYLFTDSDFIARLSVENRNVFQKIYDEIKYLAKVATAGSKEARQLEKAKRAFEKVYKESKADTKAEGEDADTKADIKYALSSYGYEELSKETRNNLKMQGVEVIDSRDTLIERIQAALDGKERQKQFSLGAIANDTKTKIETDTQQSLFKNRQYSFIVDGDDFIHISKHFDTVEEIADEVIRLFDIVSHYDNVEFKREGDLKKLVFNKSYPHADIRSVEVVSNNRNSLNLVTVFYSKKNRSQSNPLATSNDNGGPQWGSTSNKKVPQKEENVKHSLSAESTNNFKQKQLEIINATNPAWSDQYTWIRKVEDIYTLEETLELSDWKDYDEFDPDLTRADIEKAIKTGKITVYSSHPIKNGAFVTPSRIEAETYAGDGRVYQKTVDIQNVAWIDPTQGQYAEVGKTAKYSISADTEGNKLTKGQQEYFKDSKVVDENGNLKVMYHGTQNGGFHEFSNDYTDDGISFFFTDRNDVAASYSSSYETYAAKAFKTAQDANNFFAEIGKPEYEVIEKDGEYTLYDDGDEVATSDSLAEIYDEFRDWEGVGYGDVNYKVYLNLKNPLVVDAKGGEWNSIRIPKEHLKGINESWDNPDPYGYIHEATTRQFAEYARESGFDGVIFNNLVDSGGFSNGSEGTSTVAIAFESNQIKSTANTNPTVDTDIRNSLSNGEQKQYGNYNVYGKDIALQEDIAPVQETTPETAQQTEAEMFPDDLGPIADDTQERLWSLTDEDAPVETEAPYTEDIEASVISNPLADREFGAVGDRKVKAYMYENPEVKPFFQAEAKIMQTELRDTIKGERIYWEDRDGNYGWTGTSRWTSDSIAELRDNGLSYADIEKGLKAIIEDNGAENIAAAKRIELIINDRLMYGYKDFSMGIDIPPDQDYLNLLEEKQNTEANAGSFDSLMEVADDIAPPIEEDIAPVKETATAPAAETVIEEKTKTENKPIRTVQQRLEAKLENAEKALTELEKKQREYKESLDSEIESIGQQLLNKKNTNTKVAQDLMKRIIRKEEMRDNINADYEKRIADQKVKIAKLKEEVKAGESPTEQAAFRAEYHARIIDRIATELKNKGYDLMDVLKNAKNLSTFATVDNIPQRVLEKGFGYKPGKIIADETVNKVAQNETEGIKWLNKYLNKKTGELVKIGKDHNIKPGSKKSAAAQMLAEGFYVNDQNEIVAYGERELAIDFPNPKDQADIKGLAFDPRIRRIYDETLDLINKERVKNGYPEIKPLKNYFLHFRAMDDTFSRLGIPFNPNDIKAKDLPTDLNGVTADLKPGQPYFASSMHRKGKRTSFDLLGGIAQYLTSAKNQAFHISDIQTFRALRNFIADTFGQAKGLENLDLMTEEEAEARIKEVYDGHLASIAKFLNDEANIIAGKTDMADRGAENKAGRKALAVLDTIKRQTSSNMVGYNVSSAMTNLISVVQGFAKYNKADFVKAMAQTVSNRLGRADGFAENSPVMIRRKGVDGYARTPWQKATDLGFAMMSAVDSVSTEILARTKYNEFTRKGMDSEQAHIEADKEVSRLMGDRSLGQMPQLYESKIIGIFIQFQLEVRNQLDSQFYDTIQEAKLSNEDVKNQLERNAKTAAKITSKLFQLAVAQHLFGKAFEAVAGYNPAFDIISALVKALGLDDDEEDDDTVGDNLREGFLELLGDLPYTSTFTGGRIPISSALSIDQIFTGKDKYGNDITFGEALAEIAPYYLMPGGYGQVKKTAQGLSMFDDDLPIAGSYTDSGNLRFPVAPTVGNVAQAALFGQWASKNARDYFDNEYAPLKEKQIQEFIDLDIPIKDYREIREELADKDTLGEKVAYIATLDLPIAKKNILVNNAANREEPIDMADYGEFDDWGEFDYAKKYPDKYAFLQANNITVKQYNSFDDETKEAWTWAYQNPEKFTLSKSIASDVVKYRSYTKALSDISADKDENGKSISGSRKEKVIRYINSLDADYGEKIILFKSEYPSDDTYNNEIVEYLNNREDITYEEMITILTELGFTVKNGRAYWD